LLLLLLLIPLSVHERRMQREILLPQSLASSCLFLTKEDLPVTKGEFTGMYKNKQLKDLPLTKGEIPRHVQTKSALPFK
jgi:hypothetical protein